MSFESACAAIAGPEGNPFGHAPTTPTKTPDRSQEPITPPIYTTRPCRQKVPLFSLLFFWLCVCGQTPMCPLKGPTLFFLGGCQPPATLKHLPYKKGCRENDYRYDACSGVLIGLSDNQ